MNRVCLIGRLTSKPELRYTTAGVPTAHFTIAVNRPKKPDGSQEADFIKCQAWRKQAENICKYLDKGSQLSVEGRIQTGSYTDQDGNKKYFTDVVAENVMFLDNKKINSETQSGTQSDTEKPQEDPFADFGENVVNVDDNFLE